MSVSVTRMLCGPSERWITRLRWAYRMASAICRKSSSRWPVSSLWLLRGQVVIEPDRLGVEVAEQQGRASSRAPCNPGPAGCPGDRASG